MIPNCAYPRFQYPTVGVLTNNKWQADERHGIQPTTKQGMEVEPPSLAYVSSKHFAYHGTPGDYSNHVDLNFLSSPSKQDCGTSGINLGAEAKPFDAVAVGNAV
jgi:hypothetical protein